jgi:hypothetical protein
VGVRAVICSAKTIATPLDAIVLLFQGEQLSGQAPIAKPRQQGQAHSCCRIDTPAGLYPSFLIKGNLAT